jgi:hypothetical protein
MEPQSSIIRTTNKQNTDKATLEAELDIYLPMAEPT